MLSRVRPWLSAAGNVHAGGRMLELHVYAQRFTPYPRADSGKGRIGGHLSCCTPYAMN